jgi:hypothetical protein
MNLEAEMDTDTSGNRKSKNSGDDGILEDIARAIDPPSREISDEELNDPGANTPDSSSPASDKEKQRKPAAPK